MKVKESKRSRRKAGGKRDKENGEKNGEENSKQKRQEWKEIHKIYIVKNKECDWKVLCRITRHRCWRNGKGTERILHQSFH
jgi:hypothetical protein